MSSTWRWLLNWGSGWMIYYGFVRLAIGQMPLCAAYLILRFAEQFVWRSWWMSILVHLARLAIPMQPLAQSQTTRSGQCPHFLLMEWIYSFMLFGDSLLTMLFDWFHFEFSNYIQNLRLFLHSSLQFWTFWWIGLAPPSSSHSFFWHLLSPSQVSCTTVIRFRSRLLSGWG